ncbi:MAG: bifunctional phosphopantothenoylcysteine decarboxylase/phosphopantothenate--cysteine ligase CoaBC [Gammaproteobacteria bacterium AqS3]|nr:bifunctional phosphopantothenoylcysteine decarboxylase/phosphopantothenate--cysteine ligase CoaBC [Gammaproteobacteria bacterium AqS3]
MRLGSQPFHPALPERGRVLLGVSGGIAAYKSASLLRLLQRSGCEVRVVMSQAAEEFITPMTFQALSGAPVHRSALFDEAGQGHAMEHIELARWAEIILIAPASADALNRLAQGRADDLLGAVCLASDAPLILAPAMNRLMWEHPATQHSCAVLAERGVVLLGPARGLQACGETGAGRMLEPEQLLRYLQGAPPEGPLGGVRVLIDAGPTREPLDAVRYLSNRSSGRMGYALAREAAAMGAEVTLVSGPCALPLPYGVRTVRVSTAEEMHRAVMEHLPGAALFIGTAAVSDYRPAEVHPGKFKKSADAEWSIRLVRNPDILGDVAGAAERPELVVGFAAETENLAANARDKLERKRLDYVVANDVSQPEIGFDSSDNAALLLTPEGESRFEVQPKGLLAMRLLERFAADLAGRAAAGAVPGQSPREHSA